MKPKSAWFFKPTHLILFFLALAATEVQGAACCGGGYAVPSIITGDDKAQMTSSFASTEVIVDNVDSNGIWRTGENNQKVQTYKVEAAHVFWDRFQAGFTLPVVSRSQGSTSDAGLGDLSASVGYEYLPDWNYNPWRPKGIGFIQFILPTGKSRADSEVGGLDSRGNGFWALALGTVLTKSWSRFDSYLTFDVHRSWSKEVSSSQFNGTLEPGYGGNLGVGLGYNFSELRLGSGVTWTYEDPVRTVSTSGFADDGFIERFATAAVSLSYLKNEEWSGTLSLTDQTVFGSPVNTSLGRGLSFQIQRRWSR